MDTGTLTGRTLDRYVILEPLGEGGMGVVYKARDKRLGRLAALKIMHPDRLGDVARQRRFVREARAASALNHPNILTIYDIDASDGVDYIAMEYVEGGTLADLLVSGPLPVERALRLTAQVCDALAAAHAAGIVHRDLKPSNLMLTAEDRVKVVDFGLAKLAESSAAADETGEPLTMTGAVVGTAPYMSPEQAVGGSVDPRSDLFSLGAILYEMLAGRRPFGADASPRTLAAILVDAPTPLAGIPGAVGELLERCLHKEAAARFQSADELKTAVEGCLAELTARPGPVSEPTWETRARPDGADRPSVAVFPFANLSGVPEDEYLCEGLAEEIINALTRIPGLKVIARTSAFAVAGMGLDIREAGARLGVGSILEGSVRHQDHRVRVTASLLDTGDAGHLWSERYDRQLTDVLILEDEIATAIAGRLRADLGSDEEPPERPPVDVEAHTAFLEGRYYFARGTPEALAQANACYERAIAHDPNFALAYDSLAELYWYLGFFGGVPPRDAFERSTWHALRALELDDSLAETHALLGMLRKELDYNWPEVERELERAFELHRDAPLVRLRYAISGLLPHGRMDEAVAEVESVLQTDPLSLFVRWWLAVMTFLAHRPERTLEEGRHMVALEPNFFLGHWALGMGLDGTGETDEAVASLQRAHELSGGIPFTLGFLAYACGRAGRGDEARALLEEARQLGEAGYMPPSTHALAHIGLAEWDEAFEWLGQAIETRDPLVMPVKTYPFLDPVRDDPRYLALLARMHLDRPVAPA